MALRDGADAQSDEWIPAEGSYLQGEENGTNVLSDGCKVVETFTGVSDPTITLHRGHFSN